MREQLVGRSWESIVDSFGEFWRQLTNESQLRWLGPEKGVIHLAAAGVINAIWDLWARCENKPVPPHSSRESRSVMRVTVPAKVAGVTSPGG